MSHSRASPPHPAHAVAAVTDAGSQALALFLGRRELLSNQSVGAGLKKSSRQPTTPFTTSANSQRPCTLIAAAVLALTGSGYAMAVCTASCATLGTIAPR